MTSEGRELKRVVCSLRHIFAVSYATNVLRFYLSADQLMDLMLELRALSGYKNMLFKVLPTVS